MTPPSPHRPTAASPRVLIVDDDASVGRFIHATLRRTGFTPTAFTSPEEAWQKFRAEPTAYDLLMIDQQMPTLSGDVLLARVREIAPALPAILMSGHFTPGDGAVPVAGVARLQKPFDMAQLLAAVRGALPAAGPGN